MIKCVFKRKTKFAILFVLTIFSMMTFGLGQDAQAQLYIEDGFETDFSSWAWYEGEGTATHTISSNYAREESSSARFTLSSSKRAEIQNHQRGHSNFNWGTEYWQGFSFYVAGSLPTSSYPNGGLIHQHHANGPGGDNISCASGPNGLSLAVDGGHLMVHTSTNNALVNTTPTHGGADWGVEITDAGPLTTDEWHDVVANFKYATDTTGFMRVWVDGVLVVNKLNSVTTYTRTACGATRDSMNYAKYGLYLGTGTGDVYYDAIRVGDASSSYAEVAPGGGAVTPPVTPPPVTPPPVTPPVASSTIEWANPSYAVNEGTGTATFSISRSGDTSASGSVDWRTSQDTATVDLDYTGVAPTTITFSPGETSKLVSLPITDDTEVESDESFTIMLVNPTGASLGSVASSTVTITDNDDVVAVAPPQNLLILN